MRREGGSRGRSRDNVMAPWPARAVALSMVMSPFLQRTTASI